TARSNVRWSCTKVALSYSASLNPSCIRTSMAANAMPATAARSRSRSDVSCSHAMGTRRDMGPRLSPDRFRLAGDDGHLAVNQAGGATVVVESNLRFHNARIGECQRIHVEDVVLRHLEPDLLDHAGDRLGQRVPGDLGSLTDLQAAHVDLGNFRDD